MTPESVELSDRTEGKKRAELKVSLMLSFKDYSIDKMNKLYATSVR